MIGPFDTPTPAPTDNAALVATTAEQAREWDTCKVIGKLADIWGEAIEEYVATWQMDKDKEPSPADLRSAIAARFDRSLAIAADMLAPLEAAELAARSAA